MAYRKPPEQMGRGAGRARPNPGQLQTESALDRNPRFSYMETPLEVQQPVFQQAPSPTNSVIDESPISPREGHQNIRRLPEHQYTPHFPIEKPPADLAGSAYPLHPPVQLHPAYSAPVADEASPYQAHSVTTTGAPTSKTLDLSKSPTAALSSENHILHEQKQASKIAINTDRDTLIYNPHSLAGPNAAVENHRPGQVSHPNAAVEPDWKHGLCELDTLCCMGIFCPCMVYSKTQYRISKKTSKEDPTNLLGYESCNGSCGLMAFACGFQWVLASIQRARVRKLYHLHGGLGTDCFKSFCCCCCVLMQNEREVRNREELIRRQAGPASSAYIAPPTMTYAPPPR